MLTSPLGSLEDLTPQRRIRSSRNQANPKRAARVRSSVT